MYCILNEKTMHISFAEHKYTNIAQWEHMIYTGGLDPSPISKYKKRNAIFNIKLKLFGVKIKLHWMYGLKYDPFLFKMWQTNNAAVQMPGCYGSFKTQSIFKQVLS